MIDIKDSKISNIENQQIDSENNSNNVITKSYNDSALNSQTNDKRKKLDDDTINEDMMVPS